MLFYCLAQCEHSGYIRSYYPLCLENLPRDFLEKSCCHNPEDNFPQYDAPLRGLPSTLLMTSPFLSIYQSYNLPKVDILTFPHFFKSLLRPWQLTCLNLHEYLQISFWRNNHILSYSPTPLSPILYLLSSVVSIYLFFSYEHLNNYRWSENKFHTVRYYKESKTKVCSCHNKVTIQPPCLL